MPPIAKHSPIRVAAVVLAALGALLVLGATPASAQQRCADGCVDVVAVNGIIDEIEASFIIDSVRAANDGGDAVALVLQMDSPGVAVSNERLAEVASVVADSTVPVSVWIGASGSAALGGAAELVQVADFSGIAPGSTIGNAGSQRLPEEVVGELFTGDAASGRSQALEGEDAVEAGLVDRFSPTLVEHVAELETVDVEEVEADDGTTRLAPVQEVRFSKLPLQSQLFHTAASPSVAYLLLIIGLGLLLFEFFTAGIGVAGVVGAGFTILGGYGVAALPFQTWALVLILLSMVAFAIDMQTGIPRLWTIIGMAMFIFGSVFLLVEFRPTWIALAVGIIGMALTVFSGMPAMIRTRFATPTIGRDWMIGEMGEAATAVSPEGSVIIRGGLWRARANRATPIDSGDAVRVVAIDGLVLEVEPEEGGAVDYREMRAARRSGSDEQDGAADPPVDPPADSPAEPAG